VSDEFDTARGCLLGMFVVVAFWAIVAAAAWVAIR
jgi:hypothetical protein